MPWLCHDFLPLHFPVNVNNKLSTFLTLTCHFRNVCSNLLIGQINLDLRKCDLRKYLDLRKIVATIKIWAQKIGRLNTRPEIRLSLIITISWLVTNHNFNYFAKRVNFILHLIFWKIKFKKSSSVFFCLFWTWWRLSTQTVKIQFAKLDFSKIKYRSIGGKAGPYEGLKIRVWLNSNVMGGNWNLPSPHIGIGLTYLPKYGA